MKIGNRSGLIGAFIGALVAILVALAGMLDEIIPRDSHDEPVVIENGPIRVKRENDVRQPPKKVNEASKQRWTLHLSDPFTKLRVWTYGHGSGSDPKYVEADLRRNGDVVFQIRLPRKEKDGTSYATFARSAGALQFSSTFDLDTDPDPILGFYFGRLGIDKATYGDSEEYRISRIDFRDEDNAPRHICVRDANPMVVTSPDDCKYDFAPERVRIKLCVDYKKCSQ